MDDVIVPGDASQLSALIVQKGLKTGLWVHMTSRGGDVSESYAIGRLLRKQQATVTHGYCASSCVFAFLGGVRRATTAAASGSMKAGLVIHQPHATRSLQANNSIFARRMLGELKDYCREMTGSDLFHDVMIVVPFESPRALSTEEAKAMNVIDLVLGER